MLAHGKAWLSPVFRAVRAEGGEWLAESRKRTFLAPIGVCTIDQVLMSVLPLRHSFVRAFGVARSVLIVDEAHAYDSYMNALLDVLLERLHAVGSSVIVLSATLPSSRLRSLTAIWDGEDPSSQAYPLVTQVTTEAMKQMVPDEKPATREVSLVKTATEGAYPSEATLAAIAEAVRAGAVVGVVCNLVDHAQCLAVELDRRGLPVQLFHSRFLFRDRMEREQAVIDGYGPARVSGSGRVLVATQVIEQSLDIDFDWLISQLCPVDLLFQRLGRLHRHHRPRPSGYDAPACLVLLPTEADFAGHGCIYNQHRVLWRTQRLLDQTDCIRFPRAYREWIESAYRAEAWPDEPAEIGQAHERWQMGDYAKHLTAIQIAVSDANPWPDTDERASRLTRDGKGSWSVILYTEENGARCTLQGERFAEIGALDFYEQRAMNTVQVPEGWRKLLPDPDEGYYYVRMRRVADGVWQEQADRPRLEYSIERGLTRLDREPAP